MPAPNLPLERISPEDRRELVSWLFRNTVPILVMSAIFCGLGLAIVWRTPDPLLLSLFAGGVLASAARIAVLLAHRRATRAAPFQLDHVSRWERIYAAGSFAFATFLGAFSARAALVAPMASQMLAVALLFGYGSGLVARLSIRPWICVPSLALATIPPIIAFARAGTADYLLLALAVLGFAVASTETVQSIYRVLRAQLRLQRQLAGLARHDSLTGLSNRLMFEERLRKCMSSLRPDSPHLALHMVDLDGFKAVNDSMGHLAGDELLRTVGRRLLDAVGPEDLVARLGGDEFAVLQAECRHEGEAELLAWRIGRALQAPFTIDGRDARIGGSIGVAMAPRDGGKPTELIAAADAALYRAKAKRRNRIDTGGTAIAS